MQRFLEGFRGTCFLSLVFSSYTLKARVYTENTSDAWHIPQYHSKALHNWYIWDPQGTKGRIHICLDLLLTRQAHAQS